MVYLISNDDKTSVVVNICFDLNCDNMDICRMNLQALVGCVEIMLLVLIALFHELTQICFIFSLSDLELYVINPAVYSFSYVSPFSCQLESRDGDISPES